jgi:hypothetical protein
MEVTFASEGTPSAEQGHACRCSTAPRTEDRHRQARCCGRWRDGVGGSGGSRLHVAGLADEHQRAGTRGDVTQPVARACRCIARTCRGQDVSPRGADGRFIQEGISCSGARGRRRPLRRSRGRRQQALMRRTPLDPRQRMSVGRMAFPDLDDAPPLGARAHRLAERRWAPEQAWVLLRHQDRPRAPPGRPSGLPSPTLVGRRPVSGLSSMRNSPGAIPAQAPQPVQRWRRTTVVDGLGIA